MPQLVTFFSLDYHYTCISWVESVIFLTLVVLIILFLLPNMSNYVSYYRTNQIARYRSNSMPSRVVNLVSVRGTHNGIRGFYVFDYSRSLANTVPWIVKAHSFGKRTCYYDWTNTLYSAVFFSNAMYINGYVNVPINITTLNFIRLNNIVITGYESLLTYNHDGYNYARIKLLDE